MRILLVDENPLNLRMTEKRLKSWGAISYPAENTDSALRLLNETFDLILADIRLDKPDRVKLLTAIRKHPDLAIRNIPIMAISGNLSDVELKKLKETGATDCIVKPYNADELLSKLHPFKGNKTATHNKVPSSINTPSRGLGQDKEIDLRPVLEDCMGNLDTLEELLLLFKQKSLEFIGSVKLHLDRSDFKGVCFACQKVASSLKLFKAESLSALVTQINNTSRSNQDLRHLRFLHTCFVEEYPNVETALEMAFLQLKKP